MSWICTICATSNPDDSEVCFVCDSEKPSGDGSEISIYTLTVKRAEALPPLADGELTIPSEYNEIGEEAFMGRTDITALRLHAGVRKIRKSAFEGCVNLRTILSYGTLKHLGPRAFANCPSLLSHPTAKYEAEDVYLLDEEFVALREVEEESLVFEETPGDILVEEDEELDAVEDDTLDEMPEDDILMPEDDILVEEDEKLDAVEDDTLDEIPEDDILDEEDEELEESEDEESLDGASYDGALDAPSPRDERLTGSVSLFDSTPTSESALSSEPTPTPTPTPAPRRVARTRVRVARAPLDVKLFLVSFGVMLACLLVTALAIVTFYLVFGREWGWSKLQNLIGGVGGAVLFFLLFGWILGIPKCGFARTGNLFGIFLVALAAIGNVAALFSFQAQYERMFIWAAAYAVAITVLLAFIRKEKGWRIAYFVTGGVILILSLVMGLIL